MNTWCTATQASPPTEKLKRVKEEYERRVSAMSRELKRLQAAQREHTRLQRSQQHTAQQINTLRNELHNMKRDKVSTHIVSTSTSNVQKFNITFQIA